MGGLLLCVLALLPNVNARALQEPRSVRAWLRKRKSGKWRRSKKLLTPACCAWAGVARSVLLSSAPPETAASTKRPDSLLASSGSRS